VRKPTLYPVDHTLPPCFRPLCSLLGVHDSTKDKPMEVELSWLCEATGWTHQLVPADRRAAAEAWAKAAIEAEERGSDDDDE